jgi:hypothetical protein
MDRFDAASGSNTVFTHAVNRCIVTMAGRSCGRYDRSGSVLADSCDDAEYIALIRRK